MDYTVVVMKPAKYSLTLKIQKEIWTDIMIARSSKLAFNVEKRLLKQLAP